MKIYSFLSGDTTYFTTSSSLKKAQAIGKENWEQYLETCKYLEEDPTVDQDYFIPERKLDIELVTVNWFNHMVKIYDNDIHIINDELYQLIKR